MKKLFCCPALELFHCLPLWKTVLFVSSRAFCCLPPLFRCLPQWKTVRLHGKKLQNATKKIFEESGSSLNSLNIIVLEKLVKKRYHFSSVFYLRGKFETSLLIHSVTGPQVPSRPVGIEGNFSRKRKRLEDKFHKF